MQKLKPFLLLGSLILLFSCNSRRVEWNDRISETTRQQIKTTNDSVMDAIAGSKADLLKHYFSEKLKASTGNDFDSLVARVHETVRTKDYSVLDEYYIKKPAAGKRDTVFKNGNGEYAYKICFDNDTGETYVSLLLHGVEDGQLLITCIYGKYGDAWKLNVLRVGRYSYYGNTAIDIYKKAKEKYETGDVADAANLLTLIKQPLAPAFQFFHYNSEKEIKDFAWKVLNDADTVLRFPNAISEIKTEPILYNLQPMPMMEGIFPLITYGTKVNLSDTVSVKNENDELQKIIGQLFPGMEKNNKFIFFQVYQLQKNGGLNPASHMEFVMGGSDIKL